MGSYMYNDLLFKVQSLENKLNEIANRSRDGHSSNPTYFSSKSQRYESIQSLLELAKNIKHELRYSLQCSPKDKQTLKMFYNVCTLESELLNLFTSFQLYPNSNVKRRAGGLKDSHVVLSDITQVRSDYSENLPKGYSKQRKSFALKTKIPSDRCFENIPGPKYIVGIKNSSDSFGVSSYYNTSSGSSSSTVTNDINRNLFYARKLKSSYQDQPSAIRIGKRTPERIPIYINKSRDLSRRNKDKKKKHKPILKKLSSQFALRKSESNKVNVRANDLQTQETEVFLVKKKKKPRLRELSGKNSSSERYLVSRLKKVKSSNSRPLVSKRSNLSKHRKSSTPERKENEYVKKHDKKGIKISKRKEDDSDLEYNSTKYSEDSLYGGGKKKKKSFKKRFQSKKNVESRNHDFKPVTAARSSNMNNNPFYDENHIFYLNDNSFVLVPQKLADKVTHFSRNHGNGKPYSKYVNVTQSGSFKKPVRISNHSKNSNFSNTDSTYEILVSNKNNSDLYRKESNIPLCTYKTNGLNSCSKYTIPLSKTYESLKESGTLGRMKKYDSRDNNEKYGGYSSNMTSYGQDNEKSNSKLFLLKEANDAKPLFEEKKSSVLRNSRNLNNRGKNNSLSERPVSEKDNSFHSNPFGVSATAPHIYIATVPQTLHQNTFQNPPSLIDRPQHKVKDPNYIVNSVVGTSQNKESPTSLNISNTNHSASTLMKSRLSGRSLNVMNNKTHISNKSGSKIFPFKTLSKNVKNSHSEIKGNIAPLQQIKSQSRGSSLVNVQPTSRHESPDDSKSAGSNQSSTSKKSKQSSTSKKSKKWLPRSLSKLSIISKRAKKTKGADDIKSFTEVASKNDLTSERKQSSTEKQSTSEKVSKGKSWTSLKRTMSGVGSIMKLGKAKKTDKQASLQKVKSENKLKKQPSLLKRMFSKSKTQLSDDTVVEVSSTGAVSTTGYEGDKASLTSLTSSITNHPQKSIKSSEHVESKKLQGYQVASKLGKKEQPLLASSPSKNKKQALKDNPKAFNYSLHYSKEKHNCVETDLIPNMLCVVDSCCSPTVVKTCGSKNLWSKGETVLSEHELNEFEKHNKYHEFFFKPNKCQGCTVHHKNVSNICQERGDKKSLNRKPFHNAFDDNNSHLHSDPKSYGKSTPTTTSEHFFSDSSDICDWKKIANEIKECQ